ncbi:MAG: PilX N-terminal domain-containing pilus assembly protein [Myxococcota bacterium]|nr:PilX N-terminal domain-containing pilus assembly protein [Myxococcota bacterium]
MMGRRHTRTHQRGGALIVTVVVLLALLAVGMMAMRSATQNMSGSGNLRLSIQARHVAEIGLYHAVTLMNRQAGVLLPLRDGPGMEWSTLQIKSPVQDAGATRGLVEVYNRDGNRISERAMAAPPFFSSGPAPLGVAGVATGVKPSYSVSVTGFQPWTCPPGHDERTLRRNGQGCCLMHFESRAVIAAEEEPNAEQLDDRVAAELFAEHTMKAGVVIGPITMRGCRR